MNWEQAAGEWKQIRAKVKEKWAKLTDDDVGMMNAKKDALIGKIQQRYGVMKQDAERQVDDWIAGLPESHAPTAPPTR